MTVMGLSDCLTSFEDKGRVSGSSAADTETAPCVDMDDLKGYSERSLLKKSCGRKQVQRGENKVLKVSRTVLHII